MNTNKIIITLIILILLAGTVFFAVRYYSAEAQLQNVLSKSNANKNVLTFDKLFVTKVLAIQGQVSYQDTLELENAVDNTKDPDLINGWHTFLASTTEQDAQTSVLNLLSLFPDKIVY